MATKKAGPQKKAKNAKSSPKRPPKGVKTSTTNAGAILADVSAFDALSADDFGGTSFGWEDRQLLARVSRFLSSVLNPRLLRRAVGAGYSREEHESLWTLFVQAAGRNQPLAFAFAGLDVDGGSSNGSLLGEIDAFENEWFPKTRAIIERFVPEAGVDRFLRAFFKDLQQQPLGHLVLDSVSTYLDRVEALAGTDEPGAADVLRNLRTRGLSDRRVAEIRALLQRARSGLPTAAPKVDAAAWKAAQDQQAQALKSLRLAWNDWATTLRSTFQVRDQIQLGLTEVKVRAEPADPALPLPADEKGE